MTALGTRPADRSAGPEDRLVAAVRRAANHLLGLQDGAGWWKGELATNVTMEAEDLLLRRFLGIDTDELVAQTARWIRSQQRLDGTWSTFEGGPGDLSTTVEAYVALRLAGDDPRAEHLADARAFIMRNGGLERTRVFTRIWLALFGQWSWDQLPVMPPELVLLPRWVPLNIYDWACWARQTVVPMTVVCALRPRRDLGFDVEELRTYATPPPAGQPWTVGGFFDRLDRALHGYERRPMGRLRRQALAAAERWILDRQEADGSWGGIQPPWVYSVLALHLLGYPVDHPVLRRALEGLDRFTVREPSPAGPVRRLEACQSPVWDTALAVTALADAGVGTDQPAMCRARDWLLGEEITVPGDWRVRRPELAPGGWAFEFDNDGYPDTDDAAEVILALDRFAGSPAAVDRGVSWLLGMQSTDGGWASFDADQTRTLPRQLPFCDFGEVVDPPSADVTGHIVEALAARGMSGHPAVRAGVAWLLRAQTPDGSWFGRWGVNHVYGTGAVVPALIAAGVAPAGPAIRRAVRWLVEHQNDDGGWGEDLRSYRDPAWIGRGDSTASQTAWALLALLAAGERSEPARRGVDYLVETQRPDGGWDEPLYTGTGFPGDFFINYHLYRLVFPLSALGRYLCSGGT